MGLEFAKLYAAARESMFSVAPSWPMKLVWHGDPQSGR